MGLFDKLFKKQTVDTSNISEITQPVAVQPVAPQMPKRGFVQYDKLQFDSETSAALKNRYIALDVETTGLSPNGDRIIEVGAVLFENGEATKCYGTLINPGVSIPQLATAVNHITNDMIKTAPCEIDVYPDLVQFLDSVHTS